MTPRAPSRPVGTVTRGTTNPNRLRRMDRWIAAAHGAALRRAADPVAVDLGYGAAPWTAVELLERLRTVAPRARVVGRRDRTGAGRGGAAVRARRARLPCTAASRSRCRAAASLIRAANVLRQYDEAEVAAVWERLCARPRARAGCWSRAPATRSGGGTCGSRSGPEGPRTVTFATRLGSLERPSDLAERLPKALIHRNVPGEPVHAFLRDFDRAWAAAAPYASLRRPAALDPGGAGSDRRLAGDGRGRAVAAGRSDGGAGGRWRPGAECAPDAGVGRRGERSPDESVRHTGGEIVAVCAAGKTGGSPFVAV